MMPPRILVVLGIIAALFCLSNAFASPTSNVQLMEGSKQLQSCDDILAFAQRIGDAARRLTVDDFAFDPDKRERFFATPGDELRAPLDASAAPVMLQALPAVFALSGGRTPDGRLSPDVGGKEFDFTAKLFAQPALTRVAVPGTLPAIVALTAEVYGYLDSFADLPNHNDAAIALRGLDYCIEYVGAEPLLQCTWRYGATELMDNVMQGLLMLEHFDTYLLQHPEYAAQVSSWYKLNAFAMSIRFLQSYTKIRINEPRHVNAYGLLLGRARRLQRSYGHRADYSSSVVTYLKQVALPLLQMKAEDGNRDFTFEDIFGNDRNIDRMFAPQRKLLPAIAGDQTLTQALRNYISIADRKSNFLPRETRLAGHILAILYR